MDSSLEQQESEPESMKEKSDDVDQNVLEDPKNEELNWLQKMMQGWLTMDFRQILF